MSSENLEFQLGSLQFALRLSSELFRSGSNLVVSPFSLSYALSMLLPGTSGNTRLELIQTLFNNQQSESNEDNDELAINFSKLCLASLEQNKEVLQNANLLYSHKDYVLKSEYVSTLKQHFNAIAKQLDFVGEKALSIKTINGDVSKATHGMIEDIIEDVDPMTRVILVNAIYFKGLWRVPFKKDLVTEEDFHLSNGDKVRANLMYAKKKFPHHRSDELKASAVQLDYNSSTVSMVLVLPDQGNSVEQLLRSLDADKFNKIVNNFSTFEDVQLRIPKFKLSSKHALVPKLASLGVKDVFGPKASLGRISGEPLYVSDVVQQAVIEVNEEGTTAAAATAISVRMMCLSPEVEFRADRPFLFFLIVRDTKQLLFSGVVEDPTKA